MGTKGIKNIIDNKTIKLKTAPIVYFLKRKYISKTKRVANIKFNIKGLTSFTPNKK
jgi:hypothetical protein